ncbi:MAG: hypothetical protein ACR2OC_12975 [Solirubrobacterales bacterium]
MSAPRLSARGRLLAPALFALIVVAAVAILALSQSVRGRLVVDQVELTNEFRPPQEATIVFRLTEDESDATIEVIDANGEVVDTLLEGEPLGDYEIHRLRWDGSGAAPPAGYRVRLDLASLGRVVILPEEIDMTKPSAGGERDR